MTIGSLLRVKWSMLTVLTGNHHRDLMCDDIVVLLNVVQYNREKNNLVQIIFMSKFGLGVSYFDIADLKLAFATVVMN